MNHKIRPQAFLRVLFALVAVALLVVPSMLAQVERTSSIQGTVKDPSGAVVSGATVELTSPALFTGKVTATTDSSGYYRFSDLRPGTYDLMVSKSGFANFRQSGIDLAVGRGPTLDVSLKVGAATETVEVTGAAPLIDVSGSKVQQNVTADVLAAVPTGRSFQSVIQFAPGARAEPLQGGPNNGVLGFQIDGATNAENSYMIEGQETADILLGSSRTNVPMEFTQEVVIKSSGFEAEHGTASIGGIVNVIQKRGSNSWHGSVFTYYQGSTLDAAPNRTNRDNGGVQEYTQPRKDHYRIWEPGFEVGGFLMKDKLWVFASSVPRLSRQERDVFMTAVNSTRRFSSDTDTYYSLARVDAQPWQKVHIYGTWQYNYSKNSGGTQPSADDVRCVPDCATAGAPINLGGAGSNPDVFRHSIGYVAPNLILGLGGDVSITPNLIASSRWGRFYTDFQNRGLPVGINYQWRNTSYPYSTTLGAATDCTRSLSDQTLGTWTLAACGGAAPTGGQNAFPADIHASGFNTIGLNSATIFDKFTRSTFSQDLSYFHKGWGTHNFKVGYLYNNLSNDVINGYNTAQAYVAYGRAWTPRVSAGLGCTAIRATNVATWGATDTTGTVDTCRGNWGTINFREFGVFGKVSSQTHGIYIQDAWTVGHGLTLNLGIRFDKEHVPSYTAGFPSIDFGWSEKVAPRLGASWDVTGNGKLKIYGSFGYFYDVMKYDLPRGSFGGNYWQDCAYAMDIPDVFTNWVPTRGASGHFCEPSGGLSTASTATGGRFIDTENFRIPSNEPTSACDAQNAIPGSCIAALAALKPTKQHEFVLGVDWAITPRLALETRWSRKRLDRTIEDTGVINPNDGGETYSINNPGEGFNATMYGTGVPTIPRARRNYDGLEFRLTKAQSAKWFGQVSYTYSKLRGNYSGLTATDIADGGGGRQGGDVSRAFDEPMGSFDAHGNVIYGPLATDRPHALKAAGYYRIKWWKMETTVGGFQQWYSGSPLTSYVDVFGMNVNVEGRGNWIPMTAPGGVFTPGTVIKGFRTPTFSQTDLNIVQEMHVSKQNERLKLGLELTFTNLFNQHSPTFISSNLTRSGGQISPFNVDVLADPGPCAPVVTTTDCIINYPFLLTGGYNYVNELNGLGFSQDPQTFNPLYGQAYGWQSPRSIRFKVKFTF